MASYVPEFGTARELGFGQGVSTNFHAAASSTEWHGTSSACMASRFCCAAHPAPELNPVDHAEVMRKQKVVLLSHRPDIQLQVTGALGDANMNESVYAPILAPRWKVPPTTLLNSPRRRKVSSPNHCPYSGR